MMTYKYTESYFNGKTLYMTRRFDKRVDENVAVSTL